MNSSYKGGRSSTRGTATTNPSCKGRRKKRSLRGAPPRQIQAASKEGRAKGGVLPRQIQAARGGEKLDRGGGGGTAMKNLSCKGRRRSLTRGTATTKIEAAVGGAGGGAGQQGALP